MWRLISVVLDRCVLNIVLVAGELKQCVSDGWNRTVRLKSIPFTLLSVSLCLSVRLSVLKVLAILLFPQSLKNYPQYFISLINNYIKNATQYV
jgi:hypothetical protein